MRKRTEPSVITDRAVRRALPLLALCAALCVPFAACRKERKTAIAASLRPESMPTMSTVNVSTLISDSGVVQYKIVSPLWQMYDEIDTPVWRFPKGIYLQKFDRAYRQVASIAADSATYFKYERLWRLDGHVEIRKAPADLFMTEQLFWNERRGTVYSDSFIHIETATHVLEGHGFTADDRLTSYRVVRPTGIFPVDRSDLRSGSPAPSNRPSAPSAMQATETAQSASTAESAPRPGS